MHFQSIANQLPDAFADTKLVTKLHIPAANAPTCVEMSHEHGIEDNTRESKIHLKHGRPIGLRIRILENKRRQRNKIILI